MSDRSVMVLGAGMVGTCCALDLQARGYAVTLVDRREPGRETSYGNAGVLARSSLIPFNHPGLWRTLPVLLAGRTPGFRWRSGYLLTHLPWALQFVAHAREAPFRATVAALDALIRLSMQEHRRLLTECGVVHRLRENGWLMLYRSAESHAGAARARQLYALHRIAFDDLDPAALAELEPAIKPGFQRATWVRDAWSVDDPGAVVQAYARTFANRGGTVLCGEATALAPEGGAWQVRLRDSVQIAARQVVIALGPWSTGLLGLESRPLPLGMERGYHMHYRPSTSTRLSRPIYDVSGGYVLSPMGDRVRLTTGVELAGLDAPADHGQLHLAERAARRAIELGTRTDDEPWLGRRPSLPDSRPMVGALPGHPGVWLALGHQHIGFSTGPGTARLLGALISGEPPAVPVEPFAPSRFLGRAR